MSPELGLRGLTTISPHCQVHGQLQGRRQMAAIIEKAACQVLSEALSQRFTAMVIEPLRAGDPRMAEPHRLLVTLSGRLVTDPQSGKHFFIASLNTLRNGCTDLVVPAPPRLLPLTEPWSETIAEPQAENLIKPLITTLLRDRFGP